MSHLVFVDNNSPTNEIGNWASYLCAKSALGQIADISNLGIVVDFILDLGETAHKETWRFGQFERANRTLGYPFPNRVLAVAKSINEIDSLPAARQIRLFHTLQAVTLFWTKAETLGLPTPIDFTPEEKKLVEDHLDSIHLFFACSTTILDEIKTRLGAKSNPTRFGIRIAVDGVPQGRMVDFALTSNQGLDRQAHAVISFKTLELDTGRKIPAEETISEVIRKIGVRLISTIKDYRDYLRRKASPAPAADINQWRIATEDAKRNSLVEKLFSQLNLVPPIVIDPRLEDDVIILLGGMISTNLLKGFGVCALSGINTYDGLINIDCSSASVKDPNDPLSVRTASTRGGAMQVFEFKHDFSQLIDDFAEGKKNPNDLDLLVCWNIESGLSVARGSFEYWYDDHADLREMYGATHIWRDDNNSTDIPIISLKHAVCILLRKIEAQSGQPGVGTAELARLLDIDKSTLIQ